MSRRMVKVLGGIVVVTAVVGTVIAWTRRSRSFGGWHEYAPEGHEAAQPSSGERNGGKDIDPSAQERPDQQPHPHTPAEAQALDLARTAMNDVAASASDFGMEGLDSVSDRTAADRRSDLIGTRRSF